MPPGGDEARATFAASLARAPMLRFVLAALCLTSAASAQPDRRSLVVEGSAEIEVPPDRVTVVFAVETEGRNQDEMFRSHELEVARVLTAVRRFAIPDRDIEITNVSFSTDGRTAAARRSVRVTTDSLRIVPDLVAAIVDAGADRIGSVEYGLHDPDRHDNAALDRAVARAREKAERMASAMGARLGAVRTIREAGVALPALYGYEVAGVTVASQSRGVGAAYSAADQTVRARVVVEFDLIAGDG